MIDDLEVGRRSKLIWDSLTLEEKVDYLRHVTVVPEKLYRRFAESKKHLWDADKWAVGTFHSGYCNGCQGESNREVVERWLPRNECEVDGFKLKCPRCGWVDAYSS